MSTSSNAGAKPPEPPYVVFCGLDVGKSDHHAVVLDPSGRRLTDRPLPNDEAALRALFLELLTHGPVLAVVDQGSSIGALAVAVARSLGIDVGYLPGLTMRRLADLHPGEAKTDARDAFVIADAARTLPHTLRRVSTDEEDGRRAHHPRRLRRTRARLRPVMKLAAPSQRAYVRWHKCLRLLRPLHQTGSSPARRCRCLHNAKPLR